MRRVRHAVIVDDVHEADGGADCFRKPGGQWQGLFGERGAVQRHEDGANRGCPSGVCHGFSSKSGVVVEAAGPIVPLPASGGTGRTDGKAGANRDILTTSKPAVAYRTALHLR